MAFKVYFRAFDSDEIVDVDNGDDASYVIGENNGVLRVRQANGETAYYAPGAWVRVEHKGHNNPNPASARATRVR